MFARNCNKIAKGFPIVIRSLGFARRAGASGSSRGETRNGFWREARPSLYSIGPAFAGEARQHTLECRISCAGVGLHSGKRVAMTLHPAPPGTGIVFRRSDVSGDAGRIPALWDRVCDTTRCSAISNGAGTRVATVEHLMAAFAGCEIDNAVVELDGSEVPIMDGSAAPFVFLIECAGIVSQDAARRFVRVVKEVSVEDGERHVRLAPGEGLSVGIEIDFDNPHVARQTHRFEVDGPAFKDELCRARTFGFATDIEEMRNRGLARGGSLQNAVVVGRDGVINESGLRYDDEFVRHKALDVVGDLYLAGAPIVGAYQGVRASHGLNNDLLRTLFADEEAWELVEASRGGGASAWDRTSASPVPLAATA